ncbi:hypothetical protein SLA2020_194220 [Shorea laevis]
MEEGQDSDHLARSPVLHLMRKTKAIAVLIVHLMDPTTVTKSLVLSIHLMTKRKTKGIIIQPDSDDGNELYSDERHNYVI